MSLPPYVYVHRRTKDGSPRYVARVRVDGRIRSSPTYPDPAGAAAWLARSFGDLATDTELTALRALEAALRRGDVTDTESALRRVAAARKIKPNRSET
jgi:hypothetical protein